ncbi:hypothetical protein [Xanthomonas medicagonis]|uniref:hypothetical protein n=1 Tax=Xanthomonas medicagonis TaxID=3160841 RepID=UPI003513D023
MVKLSTLLLLESVIATAIALHGYLGLMALPSNPVSDYLRYGSDDADEMRNRLQRSGLGGVTHIRSVLHACKSIGFLDGFAYTYIVDVAKIPDAYWTSAAARRHWHRGPFQDVTEQRILEDASRPWGAIPRCHRAPSMNSSRFVVTFLYDESGHLGPRTPSSKGAGVMAYDTQTSTLYVDYSGS